MGGDGRHGIVSDACCLCLPRSNNRKRRPGMASYLTLAACASWHHHSTCSGRLLKCGVRHFKRWVRHLKCGVRHFTCLNRAFLGGWVPLGGTPILGVPSLWGYPHFGPSHLTGLAGLPSFGRGTAGRGRRRVAFWRAWGWKAMERSKTHETAGHRILLI